MLGNVRIGWGPTAFFKSAESSPSLKLNLKKVTLELDSEYTLSIISEYEQIPVWESSNTDVAIVDQNGNVTAVGYGKSLITVVSGKMRGSCLVNVPKHNIPENPTEPLEKLDKSKIYYGVIESPLFNSFLELTEDMVIDAIKKGMLNTESISAFESPITVKNAGDVTVILIPTSIYKGYIDDGSGSNKIPFKEIATGTNFYSNGEVKLGDFYIYGEWELTPGTTKIYVE